MTIVSMDDHVQIIVHMPSRIVDLHHHRRRQTVPVMARRVVSQLTQLQTLFCRMDQVVSTFLVQQLTYYVASRLILSIHHRHDQMQVYVN
jgi:hypothetical protein